MMHEASNIPMRLCHVPNWCTCNPFHKRGRTCVIAPKKLTIQANTLCGSLYPGRENYSFLHTCQSKLASTNFILFKGSVIVLFSLLKSIYNVRKMAKTNRNFEYYSDFFFQTKTLYFTYVYSCPPIVYSQCSRCCQINNPSFVYFEQTRNLDIYSTPKGAYQFAYLQYALFYVTL